MDQVKWRNNRFDLVSLRALLLADCGVDVVGVWLGLGWVAEGVTRLRWGKGKPPGAEGEGEHWVGLRHSLELVLRKLAQLAQLARAVGQVPDDPLLECLNQAKAAVCCQSARTRRAVPIVVSRRTGTATDGKQS